MSKGKIISVGVWLVLLGFSTWAAWQLPKLEFDYHLERFFPLDEEDTRFFYDYQQQFGGDNDYILIGLKPEKGLFEQSFLEEVDSLGKLLKEMPWHVELLSLTELHQRVRNSNPFGPPIVKRPWIHIAQPKRYPNDSVRIMSDPMLKANLIGEGGKALVLQWWHEPQLDESQCAMLADSVHQVLDGLDLSGVQVAGKCFGQTTITRTIRRETIQFTGAAIAIVVLLLWLTYRSLWGVVMPLGVVLMSVLWTAGLMGALGKPVDLISNVLPSMLLVIGLADAVHLLTHYRLFRAEGQTLGRALARAMREVGWATVLTTLTTALGFVTLTTSTVAPLVDLGWLGVLGLVAALVITYTAIPSLILLMGDHIRWRPDLPTDRLNKLLGRAHRYVMSHKRGVLLVGGVILLIGGWGLTRLKVNHQLLQDLRQEHPQQQAFGFFERYFGGARGFELALLPRTDSSYLYSLESLRYMSRLDSFLRHNYALSALVSPAEMVAYAHQVYRGGGSERLRLPSDSALAALLVDRMLEADDLRPDPDRFFAQDMARISGRMPNLGSHVLKDRHRALKAFVKKELEGAPFRIRLTGTPHLLDLNTEYLARNVLLGLLVAIGLIGLVFALLLGSFRLGLISLIPNLLPLVLVGGLMGWAGIDLRISTAIVFILAFGISVDDSIHFLVQFRQARQRRLDVGEAIAQTYMSSGKAISLTSIFLLGGFTTLCLSSFLGTFYLGMLLSLTILLAWVADLSLLPILLWFGVPRFADRKRKGH